MINFLALLLAAPAPSDDRCADLVAKYNDYTPYELCPSEQVANGADPAATLAFASECSRRTSSSSRGASTGRRSFGR